MKEEDKKAIRNLAFPFVIGALVFYIFYKILPENK